VALNKEIDVYLFHCPCVPFLTFIVFRGNKTGAGKGNISIVLKTAGC
jgi:hypothetical protein